MLVDFCFSYEGLVTKGITLPLWINRNLDRICETTVFRRCVTDSAELWSLGEGKYTGWTVRFVLPFMLGSSFRAAAQGGSRNWGRPYGAQCWRAECLFRRGRDHIPTEGSHQVLGGVLASVWAGWQSVRQGRASPGSCKLNHPQSSQRCGCWLLLALTCWPSCAQFPGTGCWKVALYQLTVGETPCAQDLNTLQGPNAGESMLQGGEVLKKTQHPR